MNNSNKMVKQETLLIAVFVALVLGFIGGVIFAVYKLDSTSGPSQAPAVATTTQGNLNQEQAKAIQRLNAVLKDNPKNIQAWIQLGHFYFDTNQPEKAIKAYTESLKLHAGNANLLTDLGIMYRRAKQFNKALETFDKAMSMDTTHGPSRLNKGIVLLYDLNKPEEAIQIWEELLKINPNAQAANGSSVAELLDHVKKNLAAREAEK